MLRPVIDWQSCQVCNPCQAKLVCRTRAIVQIDPDEPPYIELGRCSGCGACVLACCCQAIILKNGKPGQQVSEK